MRLAVGQCYFEADSGVATVGRRCVETDKAERVYEGSLNRGRAVVPQLIIDGSIPTLLHTST
jgi:hypothetical protein